MALKNFCTIKFDHPFIGEANLFRNEIQLSSNIKKLLDKGKIELVKYILYEFFYIIIRSREKKYFAGFVELINYLIHVYPFCAEFFLEEFSCQNTLIEYLVNTPKYYIKKVLVDFIFCDAQIRKKLYKRKKGKI